MAKVNRFAELRSLSPELQAEVDEKLWGAVTPSAIVAYLQGEKKVLLDKKPGSLRKMLERYRGTDLRTKAIETTVEMNRGVSTIKITQNINALQKLTALCEVQEARVNKMLTTEGKQQDFVMKQTSEEIKLYKETLVELGKLQLETGVLRRVSKTVIGTSTDDNGNITSFEWAEEQAGLYETLKGISGDNLIIDITPNPS